MRSIRSENNGYALVGVLILLALTAIITVGMLDSSSTNSKTRALVNTQSDYYYRVEETISRVVAWLQTNSKSVVTAFTAANFNNNFDLGSPTLGDNEGEHFGVPTMVKMKGTNNSVMLSNNDFFGESAFPNTEHLDTGAAFDAVNSFKNANLGSANARIILTWARATDGNYEPIFRIDVITGNNPDRGVHSYSYVFSHLKTGPGSDPGFYGRDFVTFQTGNNDCYSYLYAHNGAAWNKGAPRTNCPVASDGPMNISSDIYGTADTLLNNGVSLNPPGGNVSGDICEGPGCHSYTLPNFPLWNVSCPGNTTDVSVGSDTTFAAGGCWRDVDIDNKTTLSLTDTTNPYYFRTLEFGPNKAKFDFGNIPVGETVTIYVEKLGNDHINGSEYYNPSNAPHQVIVNYTGTDQIELNGNAELNATIVAPYAPVRVNGNFNFYGSIKATALDIKGTARVNYDETGQAVVPVLDDITFSLRKASQRYR